MRPEGSKKTVSEKPDKIKRSRGAELDPFTRTRICVLKTTAKWTYGQIAKEYPHIPISTIKSTIFRESVRDNNRSQARSGRPHKLKDEDKARIREACHANSRVTLDELLVVVEHKVGKDSLRRFMHDDGLRRIQSTPLPSVSKKEATKKAVGIEPASENTPTVD